MTQNLTDQQITEVIRRILMRQPLPAAGSPQSGATKGRGEQGDWLTADYLYANLLAHPARYGVEGAFGLPKLDKFRRVCEAMFETRGGGDKLEVKVSWKSR